MLEHWESLTALCRESSKLTIADAHVSMDGKVKDFVRAALPASRPVRGERRQWDDPKCPRSLFG